MDPIHPLLRWYDSHRRDLPWRRTRDPYAIWVSEIMLQQTQVATVIPYWERWMQRFPTVEALALADEQDVLAQWQGLGYYRRCRLLQEGARWVHENGLPNGVAEWRSVPGIGPYTAGAIASIALGEATPLVDGNVERVYARLAGDDSAGPKLNKNAWAWAKAHLHRDRPGDWNQALMELGATVCRPVKPDCKNCPLQDRCAAKWTGRVEFLPTKIARKATVALQQSVWVPIHGERFGIRQIPQGEWWEGMWEFPREAEEANIVSITGPGWPVSLGSVKHSVTHHRITLNVSLIQCESPSIDLEWRSVEELASVPMPAPQRKILGLAIAHLGIRPSH